MTKLRLKPVVSLVLGGVALAVAGQAWLPGVTTAWAEPAARVMPSPALDEPAKTGLETAVFAGGCFWGIQAVFQHVDGVTEAVSGYAGGTLANPSYEQVSTGATGHAEAVRVTFDPAKVSYGTLLQIFFSVGLDPTQTNRQGPDTGSQYRSELFVQSPDQERVARAYVAQLEAAHVFGAPIATRIDGIVPFYRAEAYHQDYLLQHPYQPYIAINDMPKVRSLEALFPGQWRGQAVTVGRLAAAK